MIKYEIKGGNLPVVICYPEQNQTLVCERGAMSWKSPNVQMQTNTGGGFGKALGRAFSGESVFLNEYTATGGSGMIAFASSFPGSIIDFKVEPNNPIVVQKGGFLAMEKGMSLDIFFQKRFGAGFFGGEGFIMQKISGEGMVFIEIDGSCVNYDLEPGQSIILDTGYLAAMSASCKMDIESVSGVKNVLFGGEGLFNTKITGPGRVYIQTMPVYQTAGVLKPYIATNK